MQISIIYHSESGNTKKVAELIAQGAEEVEGVQTRLMDLEAIDREYVRSSKAVIFGGPTYCGTFSWQMKKWFDTTDIGLADKLGSVFVTENYLGGGADVAELGLIGMMLVRGMLAYSSGVGRNVPFTHYGAVTIKDGDEPQRERARILGGRVAAKAREIFGAQQ